MTKDTPKYFADALSLLVNLVQQQATRSKEPDIGLPDRAIALERMCVAADAVRLFIAQHRHEESQALISAFGGAPATAASYEHSASQPSEIAP